MPDQIAHRLSPLYQELPAMIELENDIFIEYNPADCTSGKNIARVHFKWQKISFLDDGSTGMLHHALLVQRKHSQDPECECFWRKTFLLVNSQPIYSNGWSPNPTLQIFRIGLTITLYDFFQVSRRRAQIFLTFEANFLVFILV